MSKKMTKGEKQAATLERIAMRICDHYLGPVPRDSQPLEAEHVKRDGPGRGELIYEHLCGEFKEQVERKVPITFLAPVQIDEFAVDVTAMDQATLDLWEQVQPAVKVAWRELQRRETFGQDVEPKLEEIGSDLAYELTCNCLFSHYAVKSPN